MSKRHGFLILDACVLIDYVHADASVLGTVSRHIAPIAVVRPVFDEVDRPWTSSSTWRAKRRGHEDPSHSKIGSA